MVRVVVDWLGCEVVGESLKLTTSLLQQEGLWIRLTPICSKSMFILFIFACFFGLLSLPLANAGLGYDYFHAPQDMPQFQPGWMEPGLWRPKWIMERTFVDPESGKVVKKDKLIFKLKQDRTMKIYDQNRRPFLELWKKKNPEDEKKRKLFETGQEEAVNSIDDQIKKKLDTKEYEGTWWFRDETPLKTGHVKLETKESAFGAEEKILHDVRCEWGNIDKYAAK